MLTKETVRLSPTSLSNYQLCGEAWKQRYINKHYTPMGVEAFKGISVHKAAEENYRQKASTKKDLPLLELVEIAEKHFLAETDRCEIHWTPELEKEGRKDVLIRLRTELVKATTCYAKIVAPGVQPIILDGDPAVELELWTKIPFEDVDVNLQVRIDCISSEDGLIRIHDLKVTGKQKDQTTWDRDMQMTLGWLALTEKLKCEPEAVIIDQIVSYKKGDRHVPVYTTRVGADLEVAKRHVLAQIRGVRMGYFPPAPPGSWKCNPNWCGYWPTCEYVNPERVAPLKDDEDDELRKLLG